MNIINKHTITFAKKYLAFGANHAIRIAIALAALFSLLKRSRCQKSNDNLKFYSA